MNAVERAAAWRRLLEAGIVDGEQPPETGGDSPWFVRAMLGIAGLMAGAFGLALIGLTLGAVVDGRAAALLVGTSLCAGAFALYRRPSANDFLAQLALVASFGGQALIGAVLFGLVDDPPLGSHPSVGATAMAAVELLLFLLVTNPLHRLWCTLAATACVVYVLHASGLGVLGVPLIAFGFVTVCLGEPARTRHHAPLDAVGGALALALVLVALGHFASVGLDATAVAVAASVPPVTESVLVGLVLGGIAWRIAGGLGARTATRLALVAGALALAAVTSGAPGIPAALIVVVTGFATRRRALVGLGLLALLGYLSHFYHSLDQTLLAKSATLVGSGIALLALGLAIGRPHRGRDSDTASAADA